MCVIHGVTLRAQNVKKRRECHDLRCHTAPDSAPTFCVTRREMESFKNIR